MVMIFVFYRVEPQYRTKSKDSEDVEVPSSVATVGGGVEEEEKRVDVGEGSASILPPPERTKV
jgi:hypothetical protein